MGTPGFDVISVIAARAQTGPSSLPVIHPWLLTATILLITSEALHSCRSPFSQKKNPQNEQSDINNLDVLQDVWVSYRIRLRGLLSKLVCAYKFWWTDFLMCRYLPTFPSIWSQTGELRGAFPLLPLAWIRHAWSFSSQGWLLTRTRHQRTVK